jgi:hypothetical protein
MQTIPEECRHEVEVIVSVVREYLLEGESLAAMAFMGRFGLPPFPVPMDMKHKDQSTKLVTELCKHAKADYVIMVAEAWALDHTKVPKEEFMRIANTHESIANHPDRMDIVMFSLETHKGFWFGQSPIKSLDGKKRGFDDIQFEMKKELEGRFTSFLPRGTQH